MLINDQQLLRYDRQITVRGFDIDKQQQLLNANALIIGVGGLGCVVASYLVTAGVGQITLVDDDYVSLSNLPRQFLFTENDTGQAKVNIAKQRLTQLNSSCQITGLQERFTDDPKWLTLVKSHTIVIDCSDNLGTRQQINQLCYRTKTPLVSGAAIRMEGFIISFHWRENEPCYQCLSLLFGDTPESCVENGVISPLTGVIGSLQAMEAIRSLSSFGPHPLGKLILYDAQGLNFRELSVQKNSRCTLCSQ